MKQWYYVVLYCGHIMQQYTNNNRSDENAVNIGLAWWWSVWVMRATGSMMEKMWIADDGGSKNNIT